MSDETEEAIRGLNLYVEAVANGLRRKHNRLRHVAQILIAEVGADGPMSAEDAASKAVNMIVDLKDKLREAEMDRVELLERSD